MQFKPRVIYSIAVIVAAVQLSSLCISAVFPES